MITYVDTSTLVKLVVDEVGSDRAELIWRNSDSLASVSLVVAEARAVLAAAKRAGRITLKQLQAAKTLLAAIVGDLYLVEVTAELVAAAADFAESQALCGYDSIHLAAAVGVGASILTSADSDLCDAAARHGMHVANPLAV